MFDWSDVTRRFKDLRSLIDTKPVFRWGIITNADPLLAQLDGDDRPLAGSPSTIIGGLASGERVLCLLQNRRVTIIGRGGTREDHDNLPMARIDSTSGGRPRIATRASGWSHLTDSPYDGLQAEIKSGVLYVSGGLSRTSSHAGSATVLTLAAGYRPKGAVVQFAYMTGNPTSNAAFVVVQPNGVVIISHARTGGGNLMFGFSYPI